MAEVVIGAVIVMAELVFIPANVSPRACRHEPRRHVSLNLLEPLILRSKDKHADGGASRTPEIANKVWPSFNVLLCQARALHQLLVNTQQVPSFAGLGEVKRLGVHADMDPQVVDLREVLNDLGPWCELNVLQHHHARSVDPRMPDDRPERASRLSLLVERLAVVVQAGEVDAGKAGYQEVNVLRNFL